MKNLHSIIKAIDTICVNEIERGGLCIINLYQKHKIWEIFTKNV